MVPEQQILPPVGRYCNPIEGTDIGPNYWINIDWAACFEPESSRAGAAYPCNKYRLLVVCAFATAVNLCIQVVC